MKKLILTACALATLLFSACQRETLEPEVKGGVTYEITLPFAPQTKGEGGYQTYDLHYEVYKTADADELATASLLFEETVTMEGNTTQVVLDLLNDQDYTVLFWANKAETDYFDLTDLRRVGIKQASANNDDRDAYCGKDQIQYHDATISKTVTLTRPFAQVNIATLVPVVSYDINPQSSLVKLTSIPVAYNVFTEEPVGEDAVVTYDVNLVPEGSMTVDGQSYKKVAMNYALVPAAEGATVEVYYEINTANGTVKNTIPNVPVKKNYRTNIIGNLLTSNATYTVKLLPGFAEPDEVVESWNGDEISEPRVSEEDENIYEIQYASELAWLAAAVNGTLQTKATLDADSFAGKTFVLTEDVDLGGYEWTPIGSSANPFQGVFDGNGKTVKNLVVTGYNSNVGLFGNTNSGEIKNLTVENAKVAGRLNVGVVAGQPYTSKYSNITVTGHVEVNGMAYVGAVGGKNAYADWTNVTVNVDETSYVKANSVENGTAYRTYVGGVVGFNGEGGHTFKNITSNINVKGSTCDVGGLFGIAHYGNKFENCSCSGKVEIYAAEEAAEAQEIGGIAGVWHNETGYSVTMTECKFTGELKTNIDGVNFYNDGLVGKPYSATGTGKLTINGKQYVATAAQLQAAINAAEGETTFYLGYDIVGDVTVVQKAGVKITIEGEGHKFNGSIKVHSNSNYYADAALTIKNVNFETSAASVNVIEALENGSERYSSNLTVENCTFTATGEAVNTSVAVQVKATRGVTVTGCTATDMHSLIQAQSCDTGDVKVVNCTVNGKNGVAFKQVKAATVEGTTITALEYGIRFDGNIDNYGIVVKNNTVTAKQPLIVRKMTGANNTITLEGTNTLTTDAKYQIVITNGSDDAEYVKPTGTYTLTGAEGYTMFPEPYPVATWGEFTAALAAGETDFKLTADITCDANYQLQKSVILNLGGYSMTLPMINIHTKTTIKNGTINGKVYARKNAEIVFDHVTFSGAVADNLSTEGHLAIQGGCKSLYAKDCLFSPTSVSGSQTKPLSFEGGSSTLKFENCEFKSSPYKKQVYLNSLSATGSLDFTNCNFNNKTPNIMFAATCPLTNITMSGTTKLSSVTFEINRAKDAVTDSDLSYLRTLIANNSFSSVRVFYAGGSSEYIR